MKNNTLNFFPQLVLLKTFTLFSEYFISLSIIYSLIAIVVISRNVYGLMLQKAISECLAVVLLMACYLIINDDLITLRFLSFNNSIINDYLSFFTKLTICFFSAIYFLIIADSLKEQKITSAEYLIVILFAVLGLLLMCSSNDLLTAYLAIELSGLAFYLLASFRKTSKYSVESGVKYLVTGAISSALFLLGSSFIYGLTGTINFSDLRELLPSIPLDCPQHVKFRPEGTRLEFIPFVAFIDVCTNGICDQSVESYMRASENGSHIMFKIMNRYKFSLPPEQAAFLSAMPGFNPDIFEARGYIQVPTATGAIAFDKSFVEIGLALILFSLFIKLALAPFHLWSLDVYEGSPTNSTIFFAVITKLSLFVLLVRLCCVSFLSFQNCWQFYSLWVGILSVFIGSFGGLKQRKLKTLFAYSSISHMGYALLSFSTCTTLGLQMLIHYIIIYMLSSIALWSIMLFLKVKKNNASTKYNKELGDLVLLHKSNPALAFALAITMFSISGIPPLVGFLAKMGVFLAIMGRSFYSVALISILCSVVSTFYYIRIIKILYFESILVGKLYHPIKTSKTIILSVVIFFLFFLFVNPTFLYLVTYKIILASFSFKDSW